MSDQDATARRAELEEAVAAAEEEQPQRSDARREDAGERVAQLRDQLAARASTHPDEFADDGAARPKTEAAKLYREVQAAGSGRLPRCPSRPRSPARSYVRTA